MEREPNPQETQYLRTCVACGRRFGVLNPRIRRCLRCRRVDALWARALPPPEPPARPAPFPPLELEGRGSGRLFWVGVLLGLALVVLAAELLTREPAPAKWGPVHPVWTDPFELEAIPNPFKED